MINLRVVERLLDLLSKSNAETIEVRRWGTTIRVSKSGAGNPAVPVAPPSVAAAPPPPPAAAPPEAVEEAKSLTELTDVKAPMVGTFYAQPEPGEPPYVEVGTRIKPGQTLCIIEAMKIMNPIESEVSGVIREVAVKDATPVEFGQVLFKVDPNG